MTKGLHILVVTRIFDFIIIAIYFLCSLVLFFGRETSMALVALGVVFLVISVIILFNLKWLVILCGQAVPPGCRPAAGSGTGPS